MSCAKASSEPRSMHLCRPNAGDTILCLCHRFCYVLQRPIGSIGSMLPDFIRVPKPWYAFCFNRRLFRQVVKFRVWTLEYTENKISNKQYMRCRVYRPNKQT